jgi:hypothetical protein
MRSADKEGKNDSRYDKKQMPERYIFISHLALPTSFT